MLTIIKDPQISISAIHKLRRLTIYGLGINQIFRKSFYSPNKLLPGYTLTDQENKRMRLVHRRHDLISSFGPISWLWD